VEDKILRRENINVFILLYLILLTGELMLNATHPFMTVFSMFQKLVIVFLIIHFTKVYYRKKAF
jgi:hypothetical protein